VIASYLQSGSREWHPSGRPQRTYNLLNIIMPNSYEALNKTLQAEATLAKRKFPNYSTLVLSYSDKLSSLSM